ncbi:MAG: beta-lactamase family protein [Deltaproteobacteria bacterium]|jgi:CubicO group peptidase (beta-lactamase class C family)|nr:beta-lactamase family protein [Deltaproteobacteria bacterium]
MTCGNVRTKLRDLPILAKNRLVIVFFLALVPILFLNSLMLHAQAEPVPNESTPNAASPLSIQLEPALKDPLDAILLSKVEKGELVGVVLLVAKDGVLVYEGAAGFADRENGTPMETYNLFRLASVSKAYTAMAAGVLISNGLLDIDSPIGNYLPAFSQSNEKILDKRSLNITVRHLLNHQSGFNYGFSEKPGGPYAALGVSDGCEKNPGLTLEENLERLARAPLLYTPGQSYSYSVSSDVLGAVISSAYGKTFSEAMEELVLLPLGIYDTGFIAKFPERLTTHYRSASPSPKRMSEPERFNLGSGRVLTLSPERALDPTNFPSGGCGMVGSAPDLLILLEAIRQDGGGIVSPAVMDSFYQDAIAPVKTSPGEGFGASWGVVLNPGAAKLPVGKGTVHWGGVYGHNWYVDRENGISIVLLTNTALKGMSGNTKDLVLKEVYSFYPAQGG